MISSTERQRAKDADRQRRARVRDSERQDLRKLKGEKARGDR